MDSLWLGNHIRYSCSFFLAAKNEMAYMSHKNSLYELLITVCGGIYYEE